MEGTVSQATAHDLTIEDAGSVFTDPAAYAD
jgi:hypothetical protein